MKVRFIPLFMDALEYYGVIRPRGTHPGRFYYAWRRRKTLRVRECGWGKGPNGRCHDPLSCELGGCDGPEGLPGPGK